MWIVTKQRYLTKKNTQPEVIDTEIVPEHVSVGFCRLPGRYVHDKFSLHCRKTLPGTLGKPGGQKRGGEDSLQLPACRQPVHSRWYAHPAVPWQGPAAGFCGVEADHGLLPPEFGDVDGKAFWDLPRK